MLSVTPIPTAFEELQVCVSVVQELHVVIGRRVGVLLFLPTREENNVELGDAVFFFVCLVSAVYTRTYRHTCRDG